MANNMKNLNELIEYANKRERDENDAFDAQIDQDHEKEIGKQRRALKRMKNKQKLDSLVAKKKAARTAKTIRKTREQHRFTMTQWTADDIDDNCVCKPPP